MNHSKDHAQLVCRYARLRRRVGHSLCFCILSVSLGGCGGGDTTDSPAASESAAEPTPSIVASPEGNVATNPGQTANSAAATSVESTATASPGLTESPEVAAPEVTVDETPRPPATVEQAAKLLDLRTFPILERAHLLGPRQSIGDLYYSAPDDVQAAFNFQRQELKKLGWQELPGTREVGENPAATFTQQGFIVYVSVSSLGQGPNGESGGSSISVGNYGNVLTGKLPVPPGAEPRFSMLIQASYETTAPVEETAEACQQLLLEAGWQPYGENVHESPVSNSHTFDFKQNAVLLTARVSDHSNQPGKTFINYSTKQLTADIPAPPGSAEFRYTDSDKKMHFDTTNSPQEVAEHYVAKLGKLGWEPTTEELIFTDDREAMMIFRNEGGDRIDLDIGIFSELTRVVLKHFTPAEIEELDRQIAALAEQRKQEAADREAAEVKRREALTFEFPIPENAKEFDLEEDGDGLEITMPGGTGAAALAALRKHFVDAGWEEEAFSADETTGSLTVNRGDSKLWLHYISIGAEDDFELDVTCFSAYLKPVQ